MRKTGGILAIVGASLSMFPLLFGFFFGALIIGGAMIQEDLDIEASDAETEDKRFITAVDEDGVELTSEEMVQSGTFLMAQFVGSLFCCLLVLVFGIVALGTRRPLLWGLVIIGCAVLGLILARLFAIVLVISILGGILLCFAKPKIDEFSDEPVP